jgi:hypothetical protein
VLAVMTVVLNDAYVWEEGRLISSVQLSDLAPLNDAILEKIFAEAAEIPATSGADEQVKSNGWTPLEPDAEQLQLFINALFSRASDGVVSFRTFADNGGNEVLRISPTPVAGGLDFIAEVAEDDARRAANHPKTAVFCHADLHVPRQEYCPASGHLRGADAHR